MASIIKDNQQVKALEEITAALETIRTMNTILQPCKDGTYQVQFAPVKGRASRVEVSKAEIEAAIIRRRKALIREVNTKAAKWRIDLDTADMAIMSDEAIQPPVEQGEKTAEDQPAGDVQDSTQNGEKTPHEGEAGWAHDAHDSQEGVSESQKEQDDGVGDEDFDEEELERLTNPGYHPDQY